MTTEVTVLLATYNGARWLPEQLDSLLGQTGVRLHVLVRDDGSTDGTLGLLADYQRAHPGVFSILPPDGARRGPRGSFAALLDHALGDPRGFTRFMFCDQDDLWFPHKAATLLAALEALPADRPRLAHGDARVVDLGLAPLAESFWGLTRIDPARTEPRRLLLRNVVIGHCALFDRALAERAAPIPSRAYMHDWWLALTAAAFGSIVAVPAPLGLYRQHGSNAEGARDRGPARLLSPTHWRRRILAGGTHGAVLAQAEAWVQRYGHALAPELARDLRHLDGISRAGWLSRRARLLRSRVRPATLVEALDYLLKC
jgi:glycosyltransferase involved in cell wall biosynthesis